MRINEVSQTPQITQLMERYYQPLFHFAAHLCGSPARAMLLTQRTFRLAFDRSRNLPIPANVRVWLFTILFNNFLKNRATRPRA